jgi:hypothetical protein
MTHLSEQQIIDIIDKIASRLGPKFRFGYHTNEDMKQQASLFAWDGMVAWDGVRPLENFLWVHVRNRLYNFKRNNYGRPEKPCEHCPLKAYDPNCKKSTSGCTKFENLMDCGLYKGWTDRNASKRNLMSSYTVIFDQPQDIDASDIVFKRDLFDLLDRQMPVYLREDWIRLTNNLKISKIRRQKILDKIEEILKENDIDPETW